MSLFVPKEWKDRLAEFAGRRKLTNVSTGEETTVDVSRAEGEVSQAGDAFSAANMNDLEQRIKDGFDKVDTNLTANNLKFKFGYDGDSDQYGYYGADGSLIPFSSDSLSLVWENQNSYQGIYDDITFNFDFGKYNNMIILTKSNTGASVMTEKTVFIKDTNTSTFLINSSGLADHYARKFALDKADNTVTISPNNKGAGAYQEYTIPVRVYGFKTDVDLFSVTK